MGRVRGVVLQRLSAGRALVLTRSGAFCEVWLGRGCAAGARVGAEVEGLAVPRVVVVTRLWLQTWPRAAVATAVAFGAAGALFALAYLRLGPGVGPGFPGTLPGEETAGAGTRSGPVVAEAPAPSAPGTTPASLSWRLEPPGLSGGFTPGEWASVRMVAQEMPSPGQPSYGGGVAIADIGEALRRALGSSNALDDQANGPLGSRALGVGGSGIEDPAHAEPPGGGEPAVVTKARSERDGVRLSGAGAVRGEGRAPAEAEAAAARQLSVPTLRRLERSALRWP